jgi:hypothetical protein
MAELNGKVAIVTGASKGIGPAGRGGIWVQGGLNGAVRERCFAVFSDRDRGETERKIMELPKHQRNCASCLSTQK